MDNFNEPPKINSLVIAKLQSFKILEFGAKADIEL